MNNCVQCGVIIELGDTKPKRFCSDRCRKRFARENGQKIPDKKKTDGDNGQVESIVFPTEKGPVEIVLPPARFLDEDMLDTLPHGVVRPTGQPTAATQAMTALKLSWTLAQLNPWQDSPEYAEIVYRLLTMTLDELKEIGQDIPNWKEHYVGVAV